MVELLRRSPIEVERAREATWSGGSLEDGDLVTILEQIEGGGQPHDSCANNNNLQSVLTGRETSPRSSRKRESACLFS